jgi:hypothetical protein
MEQPEPAGGGVTPSAPLAAFARPLLGATVTGLWRLVTVSADGSIPLLGTLVPETDNGFVVLSYSQDGLSCRGPMPRAEIRWDTEPDLPMGQSGDVEEWLDLAPYEGPVALPLFVAELTGWFGVGAYVDAFALVVGGRGRELVVMTTDEFDLRIATREEARRRAEVVAANMNLRPVDQEVRL